MQELKPFYFIVVVWGKRFRDYLTEYCIPSLLAPGNIPALKNNSKNKFLICTTPEDWQELQKTASFQTLSRYLTPVLLEIPPPPPHVSSCIHMGIGHKLGTDLCFKDKTYGIVLAPDFVLSDNALSTIQSLALQGKQVVLCPALRFAEEPFFQGLDDLGLRSLQTVPNTVTELAITPRQLVQLSLRSFHSETHTYDFASPYYMIGRAIALWRMPNNRGMVMRCMSWSTLLLDYSAIKQHDTTALEKWTIDGDYVHKNFGIDKRFHACVDSDELMLISWAPLNYNSVKLTAGILPRVSKKIRCLVNQFILYQTLNSPVFDNLKLKLSCLVVRWHTDTLDKQWFKAEKKIVKLMPDRTTLENMGVLIPFIYRSIYRLIQPVNYLIALTRRLPKLLMYILLLIPAALGNKTAKNKIKRRIQYFYQHTLKR